MTLHVKFQEIEASMNQHLFEREAEIHTAILALLTGLHHFQYGEPGTGKSMLVVKLVQHLDLKPDEYFQYQLHKTTMAEEILGGMDMAHFKKCNEFRKNPKGKLPEAVIAFLDEGFNGSSAILNALLLAAHERQFDRGDMRINIPLRTMFMGSNFIPQTGELAAFADRLHFWHEVKPIQDPSNKMKMMMGEFATEPLSKATLDEVYKAEGEIAQVEIPQEVAKAVMKISGKLQREGIPVSDRRLAQAMQVVRAEAWLNGRDKAVHVDLLPLAHMFWKDPKDRHTVDTIVLEEASPLDRKIRDIKAELLIAIRELNEVRLSTSEKPVIIGAAGEVSGKLIEAQAELNNIAEKLEDERELQTLEEAKEWMQDQFNFIRTEVYQLPAKKVGSKDD